MSSHSPAELEHPKPSASWETRAYWEGAGRHELVLQRCDDCGVVQHRPRAICASCLSSAVSHFVASGRGSVYTYTVTHQNGVPPFRDAVPYVLAYVDLEEGPRLMTNIVGCAPDAVRIGMDVVVDFQDADTREFGEAGGLFAVPRFRPA
jgi:uncharacterized OB-fold protein